MLIKDPAVRFTIPEVLNHPWVTHFDEEDETDLQTDVKLNRKKCGVMTDD
jgi:serine/threonine protein kinase